MGIEIESSDNRTPYERFFGEDSLVFARKLNTIRALKFVCLIVTMAIVSVTVGVLAIFTIKCLVAFPEMSKNLKEETKFNKSAVIEMAPKLNGLEKTKNMELLEMNVKLERISEKIETILPEMKRALNKLAMKNDLKITDIKELLKALRENYSMLVPEMNKTLNQIEAKLYEHFEEKLETLSDIFTGVAFLMKELKKKNEIRKGEDKNTPTLSPTSWCYHEFHEQYSFYSSRKTCGNFGGFLADLTYNDTNKFMNSLVHIRRQHETIWLGAWDQDTDGVLRWENSNKSVESNDASWGLGEPYFIDNENCLAAFLDHGQKLRWQWRVMRCSTKHIDGFICQKKREDKTCDVDWLHI